MLLEVDCKVGNGVLRLPVVVIRQGVGITWSLRLGRHGADEDDGWLRLRPDFGGYSTYC